MTALARPEPASQPDGAALTPEELAVLARFAGPVEVVQAWHVARGYGVLAIKSMTIDLGSAAATD